MKNTLRFRKISTFKIGLIGLVFCLMMFSNMVSGQISSFPYTENCDASVDATTTNSPTTTNSWDLAPGTGGNTTGTDNCMKLNVASNDSWVWIAFTGTNGSSYVISGYQQRTATFDVYISSTKTTAAMISAGAIYSNATNPSSYTLFTCPQWTCSSTGTYYVALRVQGNASTARLDDITISQITYTNYYSASSGNLNDVNTWWTNTDGATGSHPANFTANYQIFNIRNNATPSIGATWTVAGTGSKVIVGNGTNACNFTIPSGFNFVTTSPAVVDVANAGILTMSFNGAIPTFGTLSSGSTIDYAYGGAQTISSATYHHLKLSTSGAKSKASSTTINGNLTLSGTANWTLGGDLSVGGDLNVGDGTTLTIGGYTTSIIGTTTVGNGTSGLISITNATGTKTFGAVTINSGGELKNITAAEQIDFNGNVTINVGGILTEYSNAVMNFGGNFQNDGTYTASTGIHTFSGSSKTFSGINSIVIPSLTISGTISNNNTVGLTVSTALAGAGTLSQGSGAILNIGGTASSLTISASASSNQINYTGAAQGVLTGAYYNVAFSGSGAKTLNGNVTIDGTTTLTAGALTIGANILTLNGGISATSGTLVGGATSNLVMGATATLPASLTSLLNLTLNTGTTTLGAAVTIAAAGVVTLNGGIVATTATNILQIDNTSSSAITTGMASSFVNGPLKRIFASGANTGSFYFPVGVGSTYLPFKLTNPTTSGATGYLTVEAKAASCGGSAGTCVSSVSTTEYWVASALTRNFTAGIVSIGRQTALASLNTIGKCATVNGAYASINGMVNIRDINTSTDIGTISAAASMYFAMVASSSTSPSISSPTSTSVSHSTVTLGGNITNIGCSSVIEKGIYYSTSNGFADGAGTKVSVIAGPYNTTGAFTIPVSGLTFNTIYYYKAFATNATGTVYTSQGTFTTTQSTFPLVETYTISLPSTAGSATEGTWTIGSSGPYHGSYYAYLPMGSSNNWLFTPLFSATAGKVYTVSYYDYNSDGSTRKIYLCTSQSSSSADLNTDYFNGTNNGASWTQETSTSWLCPSTGTYCFGFKASSPTANLKLDYIEISEVTPATITWDGSTDGTWSTGSNWDLNRAPIASDIIVIPATGVGTYPSTIPSGSYNELTVRNASGGTITIGNGTAITLASNLTISSTGNPVTIANTIAAGGNISLGASGSAFSCNVNAALTAQGTATIGSDALANTFNIAAQINSSGNATFGNNTGQTYNITYCDDYDPFLVAANSSSGYTLYGTYNYSGSGQQIMLPNNYKGNVTLSGSGSRYQLTDMNFDKSLNIQDVTYYPADHNGLNWGSGSTQSGGTNCDNSPYRGANQSQRWQTILYVADLNGGTYGVGTGISSGDFIKSLSFYVQSKNSSNAFKNFTIKMGHTSITSISHVGEIFSFESSPSTTVFTAKDISTVSGLNNHLFDTDFQWNGTDNVLVEITWNNGASAHPDPAETTDDQIRYTQGIYGDDMMITQKAAGADCTGATDGQNYNARPNLIINYVGSVHNITIARDWNNTTGIYVAKGNTVTFDGSTGIHDVNTQTIRTNGSHFYNATFTNPNGYILSTNDCVVEHTLTMTDGNFTTGSNILQLGTSISNLGTLSRTSGTVVGYFKRWFASSTVSNVLFPVGTSSYYRPAVVSFTGAPIGGSLTSKHTASDPGTNSVDLTTSPVVDGAYSINKIAKDCYWTLTAGDGLTPGTYSVDMTADHMTGVTDYSTLHLIKRANSTTNWSAMGTHVVTSGSNTIPILHRTGLTTFSDFVPGSGPENSLPVEILEFKVACLDTNVLINWTSSSETNNDFYTIEKSYDLENWSILSKIDGAGNSNAILHYHIFDKKDTRVAYYRLKQTDFDGKYEYFKAISSNCIGQFDDVFKVYPIPSESEDITIEISSNDADKLNIQIFNTLGQDVYQLKYETTVGVNKLKLSDLHLANGTYHLMVVTESDKVYYQNIVVR